MSIDTRSIIINLLKEDKKDYISIKRLQKLLMYIYDVLCSKKSIGKYTIYFDINFDAIERTVLYNNNIFKLDIEGDLIYLRHYEDLDNLAQKYAINEDVVEIIQNFCRVA